LTTDNYKSQVWVTDDLASQKIMQLREAGIVDSHAWVVNPKSGEQVGSWELMERMEKTYGQPAVAILWKNLLTFCLKLCLMIASTWVISVWMFRR
jgi:hypothetical protein